MKKIIYVALIAIIAGSISSCKDMDEIYRDFVVPNGLKYPQRPDSLKVLTGYNKLRITWLEAKDPSLTHAMIYWNNYLDSLKVDLNDYQDTIIVDIDNLAESTYTFYVRTYDSQGNSSILSEVSGTTYGDNYTITTNDRSIESALRDAEGNGIITWKTKTTDLAYSEVRYTTSSGEKRIVRSLPDDILLKCPDIKPGELFEYRSVFLPKNGIDPVIKEWKVYDNPFSYMPDRGSWTAVAKNGHHDWGDGGGGQTALLFDGMKNTGWHSKVGTPFPQCVSVDMKEPLLMNYILIYPPAQVNWRYLKDVNLYLTDTPINPDRPDLESFLAELTPVATATYSGEESFKLELTTPATGRYLTLLFIDGTQPYISFMELEVYGY